MKKPIQSGSEAMPEDTKAAPADAVNAIDIESALYDLAHMARIASELITDDIGGSHKHITGNAEMYHLAPRQRERLLFSVHHVQTMADDLLAAFNRGETA